MEGNARWLLITAIAPIAWGASYWVTAAFLPPDYPLWAAVIRALPGGIVVWLLSRKLPTGSWWWKSAVLGILNVGAFFVLVYVAAQLLPSSIATTLMATSPAVMMFLAWPLLAERPKLLPLVGAILGFVGVCATLLTGTEQVNLLGAAAALTAMLMSSVGYILTKKWGTDVDVYSQSSWQLIAGGLFVIPFAFALEGAPPALGGTELLAFGFLSFIATGLAYVAWFTGLKHLSAGAVGLVGLLNPVAGVLLGVLVASESLSLLQGAGIAIVLAGILIGQPIVTRALQRRRTASRELELTTSNAG
ncbi:EamA family transporter [Cryobacterium sp. BB307]|uniref:DMT family transporter n=1 Tax=Cryobacterium sp. BB307 TaxID=2716317 RepID=UPI001444A65C|nr:EamA family transporter [Cryobacterium sp. BB307]